jgi:glycosyltransferase involved in cell wall biosynthesis
MILSKGMSWRGHELDGDRLAVDADRGEQGHDVLVFVPSLNDVDRLGEISQTVAAALPLARLLVVDDGSTVPIDRRILGVDDLLVRLPTNMGLGVATHVAIDHALAYGYQIMVRIDADGQHPMDAIPELLEPLRADREDVVSGERLNPGAGNGGLMAGLVKGYFTLVSRLLTAGRSPADVNTGFMAMNRTAMSILNGTNLYRFPEPQIFLTLGRAGLRLAAHPIHQQPRRHGKTTLGWFQAMRLLYRFNVIALNETLGRRRRP